MQPDELDHTELIRRSPQMVFFPEMFGTPRTGTVLKRVQPGFTDTELAALEVYCQERGNIPLAHQVRTWTIEALRAEGYLRE